MPEHESTPVPESDFSELMGPELASALAKKGYSTLTSVQRSVLEPGLAGRDLRISSQTGSGKTLAIGFVLREAVSAKRAKPTPVARPQALVIEPTRELAKQVHDELAWLYAPMNLRIASVTGGAVYRDEHRALAQGPAIVVGTPGRLLDHLNRGGIEAGDVTAVVLDEADRMLDLGFRDELEAILAMAPKGHRTHLVSATFARDVAALADRVQVNPLSIEGTPLGSANCDIDHIVYLVNPRERVDALINVLLHHADEQTLVFARTRADVAEIARELQQAGFASGSLSGEMDQHARNRALAAFKRGDIRALIATDVAARGIDVQDIARVVQIDPPTDPDTYTHRSGRTGRAGRKGTSALLVPPAGLRRTASLLQRARVAYRIEPIPTAAAIRAAQDERWLAVLTQDSEREVPARVQAQVQRIVESGLTERALAQLIVSVRRATGEPRDVTPLFPEPDRGRRGLERGPAARGPVPVRVNSARAPQPPRDAGYPEPRRDSGYPEPRRDSGYPEPRRDSGYSEPRRDAASPERGSRGPERDRGAGQWVPFRVSWGEAHGADARRLVAMLCRRGNIRGSDIGAIRVSRAFSSVEVAAGVASSFAEATREPDPRDPRVSVTPMQGSHSDEPEPTHQSPQRPRAHVAPSQHRPQRFDAATAHRPHSAVRTERGLPPQLAREAAGKPARQTFSKSLRDAPSKPLRDAPSKPLRDAPSKPLRDAPSKPLRDAPSKPLRDAPSKPLRDTAPKLPSRRIVVNAPPPRKRPKSK